jgi:uncharacterized protein YbjT (DUF2867 family)
MQHLAAIWNEVVSTGVHAMPFGIEQKFNVADLADLAEAAAVAACSDDYDYGTFELAGPEALSQIDMARIIGEVIGKPVRAQAAPMSEVAAKARAAGASDDRIEQMTAMNAHYDRYGFRGNSVC